MARARATGTNKAGGDLREALVREHDTLQSLFADVVDAFDTGNGTWAASCFSELERQLSAHMEMEEEHVFPGLSRVDPVETRALLGEHAAIRSQLASLAVGVDLHTTRAAEIGELVAMLRAHAGREDALAYRWAETHLAAGTRASLLARVEERMAKLAEHARSRRSKNG